MNLKERIVLTAIAGIAAVFAIAFNSHPVLFQACLHRGLDISLQSAGRASEAAAQAFGQISVRFPKFF